MLVYVDDLIITGTHSCVIHSTIVQVQSEFPLKDLGALIFFLGIQVTCTNAGLHLCQTKYIKDLLLKTHMDGAKPTKSPCASGSKLDGEPLHDPTIFCQVVVALQYCTLNGQRSHFQSINYVNICTPLPPRTGLLLKESGGTSKVHLTMVSTTPKAPFNSMLSATLCNAQEIQALKNSLIFFRRQYP
jgi:hypothetical protein